MIIGLLWEKHKSRSLDYFVWNAHDLMMFYDLSLGGLWFVGCIYILSSSLYYEHIDLHMEVWEMRIRYVGLIATCVVARNFC